MSRRGNGLALSTLAAALALAAALGCAGDPGPVDAGAFKPIPLTACRRDPVDGLSPDQRSLVAMIAALHARGYPVYQVSPTELTIYTRYREVRRISVAWQIRFGVDGAGELTVPETMPPQSRHTFGSIREWGRALAATYDKLKCLPREELRSRCVKAGFSF